MTFHSSPTRKSAPPDDERECVAGCGLVASGAVAWLVRWLFSLTGVSPRVDRATSLGCSALVEQCVRKLSRQRWACDRPRSSVLWLAVAGCGGAVGSEGSGSGASRRGGQAGCRRIHGVRR